VLPTEHLLTIFNFLHLQDTNKYRTSGSNNPSRAGATEDGAAEEVAGEETETITAATITKEWTGTSRTDININSSEIDKEIFQEV